MDNVLEKLRPISTIMLDVDGVLTDGTVLTLPDGDQVRRMNIKDGYALQHAVKKGYNIIIISGGTSESVRKRLQGLGVKEIYLAASNKVSIFEEVMEKHQLKKEQVLYMGDDIPDFRVMQAVGIAACPKDAANEIKEISDYICANNGGEGCVREMLEKVLKLQDNWFDEDAHHW